MNVAELSKLRGHIEKLSASSDNTTAALAQAIEILNDSLRQHMARIMSLEKELASLKRKPRHL